jgi:hypothetical protein
MKRVVLAVVLLVVGGISALAFVSLVSTIFRPRFPSTLGVTPQEATNMSAAPTSSAPVTAEAEPAPDPSTPPSPQKPQPPQVASLPDAPPPTVAQTPPAPRSQARPAFDATEKEIRNLSDGHCGGRTMKSITVLPDGNVKVQC